MKIGIIGSGNMGRTLGLLWMEKGHDVFFGAREAKDLEYIQSLSGTRIKSGSLTDAILNSDVLLYSIRGLPSTICKREFFKGKVLIDINNWEIPTDFIYPVRKSSFSEKFQEDLSETFIAKGFNTIAQETYNHSTDELSRLRIINPFCSSSQIATNVMVELISCIGMIPLNCGTINQSARLLESFADLVRHLMTDENLGLGLTFSTHVLSIPKSFKYGIRQPTKYK